MLPLENLLAFAIASVVIIAIPGPSVLFALGRSIALGPRAGILSVLGNALGTIPAVVAVAFGVGAIVAASVTAFTIIKLAGARLPDLARHPSHPTPPRPQRHCC